MPRPPLFHSFVGIDQTGAVLPGSQGTQARPLAWAIARLKRGQICLEIPEKRLPSFHLDFIDQTVKPSSRQNTAVLIDCVLGLPRAAVSWPLALRMISSLPQQFGRAPAEAFFSRLLKHRDQIPTRLCEELAGANSVFRTRPFQKNIQTGTFRLWRDFTSDPRHAEWAIWPFSTKPAQYTLFEGYPSLMWKTIAHQSRRDPRRLGTWLRSQNVQFSSANQRRFVDDPDLADAIMLAVGGCLLSLHGKLLEPFPHFFSSPAFLKQAQKEGWIAGLCHPSSPTA